MKPDEFKTLCDKVEGYTTLGLVDEAFEILESLPSKLKVTKEVITLHIGILVKSGEYLKASYLAEALFISEPDNADRVMMVARYRLKGGEVEDALTWLQRFEKRCGDDASYFYLKGQCHAALGNLEAAKESLEKTFAINPDMKLSALEDPVFEGLW